MLDLFITTKAGHVFSDSARLGGVRKERLSRVCREADCVATLDKLATEVLHSAGR